MLFGQKINNYHRGGGRGESREDGLDHDHVLGRIIKDGGGVHCGNIRLITLMCIFTNFLFYMLKLENPYTHKLIKI